MTFRDRNLSFEDADRRYAELVRKRQAGSINERAFDDERQRLMVLDKEGRWWAKSAATGDWNFHDGKAWVRGVPPDYRTPTGGASAVGAPGSRAEARRSESANAKDPRQEAGDGEQRASRLPLLGLSVVAGLLILGLLGWGAYTLNSGTSGPGEGAVKVPDLAGAASLEEARKIAGERFKVVEGNRVESRKPVGTILGQDPAAGKRAELSSTISVDLSRGVDLPDVEGKPREEAVRILSEKGFQVEGEFEKSSAEEKDRVIGQDPKGGKGESVEAGTAVEITVGKGPADESGDDAPVADQDDPGPAQLSVPNVLGASVDEATQTLQNAGFAYDVRTVQSDDPAGTVVSTEPAPGTPLDPDSRAVIINQSSGPSAPDGSAPATAPPADPEPPDTEPPHTEPWSPSSPEPWSPDPASPSPSSPDPSSPAPSSPAPSSSKASPAPTDEGG